MSKYILIGLPLAGKSTLGKRVAEVMNVPFFDTDQMVLKSMKVEDYRQIFRSSHQRRFLDEQVNAIEEISEMTMNTAIIATGAEMALQPRSHKFMHKIGTIIYIKRKTEDTIKDARKKKGLIIEHNRGEYKRQINMNEEAVRLYAKEIQHYEKLCDVTFENYGTEAEGAEKLIKLILELNTAQKQVEKII